VNVVAASDLDLLSPTLKRVAAAAPPAPSGGGVPAAPASAPVAASPEELAAGRALLEAIVKAHGGEAFLNIKTLVATAKAS
jgi:hypothetical protein